MACRLQAIFLLNSGKEKIILMVKEQIMPELPDLTVFAENLDKMVTKKKITGILCHRDLRLNVPPQTLAEALQSTALTLSNAGGKKSASSQ